MIQPISAAVAVYATGLIRAPPHVLITRWLALLAEEEPLFFDAAHDAGPHLPGARYTFLAITNSAVCYLSADHDDEFWEHDRALAQGNARLITPRSIEAWRRPLTHVTEIGLADDVWRWLPERDGSTHGSPTYTLTVGSSVVELPLSSRHRNGKAADPGAALDRLTEIWQQGR